jgi:hypothetical protein
MKRKAVGGDGNNKIKESNNTTTTDTNTSNGNGNEESIDNIIEDIKNGKNIEMIKRAQALQRIKERTIAAADRHKKLQMKNISELYDYEVADAEAQYQKAYEEVLQRLIAEVKHEDQKKNKRMESDKDQDEKEKKKSLRSNATIGSDSDLLLLFNKSSKKKDKTISGSGQNASILLKSLPEDCVRSDFRSIVMDIEHRAKLFAEGIQKVDAKLKVNADSEKLEIGNETYYVGDCIIALSILSQESLFGIITSISHNDVIVKCSHGQGKFSFRIGQITNGRIKISRDLETAKDQGIINHAIGQTKVALK